MIIFFHPSADFEVFEVTEEEENRREEKIDLDQFYEIDIGQDRCESTICDATSGNLTLVFFPPP
jgi:hypothetical protein